jgi:uncharacterized protein (TIGR02996 family)
MSDHDAFLQEILAHPDDDTPRLIYADWLEERGDPRGEFIRVQCALVKVYAEFPRYRSLYPNPNWSHPDRPDLLAAYSRQMQLLRKFEKQWIQEIREYLKGWRFQRGFVEEVTLGANLFLRWADLLFAKAPIQHLSLHGGSTSLKDVAGSIYLRRLRSLEVQDTTIIDLDTLATSPHLAHLTPLNNTPSKWGIPQAKNATLD